MMTAARGERFDEKPRGSGDFVSKRKKKGKSSGSSVGSAVSRVAAFLFSFYFPDNLRN